MQNILAQAGYGSCLTREGFISNGWVRSNRRAPEFRKMADPTVDKFAVDGESIVTAESLIRKIWYKLRIVMFPINALGLVIVLQPTTLLKICCSYYLPIHLPM